jgi:small-conductance mechanosensitive channel
MSKDNEVGEKPIISQKRPIIITFTGAIIMIFLILATLEVSHRNIIVFVSNQQKYILAIEAVILAIFVVELLVTVVGLVSRGPQTVERGARLRLLVRIVGYFVGLTSVVSILASNVTLGISVGAVVGAVIVFAAQNIVGSVMASVLLLSTQMVRVGEEITINETKGMVSEIRLTHMILSIGEDVVFIPNSLVISSMFRRKKRNSNKDASVRDW